jgi:K+-transporting ATPase KdpF subunit
MILAVEWQDAVGLVLAVLAVIYLVLVLIFPERF